MPSRRSGVFFLLIAVALSMFIFSYAFLSGGKDAPFTKYMIKQADSVMPETQAPNPHGKSNH